MDWQETLERAIPQPPPTHSDPAALVADAKKLVRRRRLAAVAGTAAAVVEERSELFAALQALPEMQRKVVVLRHWLQLSVAETARELRISEGTVKSHSSRGLAALRTCLESGDASRT